MQDKATALNGTTRTSNLLEEMERTSDLRGRLLKLLERADTL